MAATPSPTIKSIPVDLIRPGSNQARRHFDQGALAELARSVGESGVIQPIVVRTTVWGFELLAGERRWRAAQLAGIHQIPAVVRDDLSESEAHVLGLIENLQRESLSPIETAAGLKRLADSFELTHDEIGDRIGKSREYVSNYLRLLNLEDRVATLVNEGHILLGHAKVLAGLEPGEQIRFADDVIRQKLTVRQLERRVSQHRNPRPLFGVGKPGDMERLERELSDLVGSPVAISMEKTGHGELRISFHNLDELDGVLSRLGYRNK